MSTLQVRLADNDIDDLTANASVYLGRRRWRANILTGDA